MPFNFEKHKRKLELDDFKFSKKSSIRFIDWIGKKKKMIGSDLKVIRVFEDKPSDKDLQKFVDYAKGLYKDKDPSEILLVAPECDNYALRKFIQKTGILTRGNLNELITVRFSSEKISNKTRNKIVEEEIKKPKNIKKLLKTTEDFKAFKKICRYAKGFEITKMMKSKEMHIEQIFWTYLSAKFGKKEQILYEKPKGSGRLDIFLPKRKIGVELKMIKGKADLDRVFGQVHRYKNDYDYMCVILINIKGYPLSELKPTIKGMKELGNVEVILR